MWGVFRCLCNTKIFTLFYHKLPSDSSVLPDSLSQPPPQGFFKQKIPGKGIIHPLLGHSHTQQHLIYSTSVIHHPAIPLRRPYPISQPPPPGIPWTPACPCTPRPGAYSILCASAAAAPFPPVHPRSSGLGLADCGGTYRGKQRPASRP